MKGKISKEGFLMIKRGSEEKLMRCPRLPRLCGDWCALFGEPQKRFLNSDSDKDYEIDLCQRKTMFFDTFMDERE